MNKIIDKELLLPIHEILYILKKPNYNKQTYVR